MKRLTGFAKELEQGVSSRYFFEEELFELGRAGRKLDSCGGKC